MGKKGKEIGKNFVVSGFVVGLILLVFLAGAGAIYLFSQNFSSIEKKTETIVVLKETGVSTDLPNADEGTVRIDFRALDSDVNIGETTPTKVLLFRSKILEGLNVYYLYDEKSVTAGMPLLESSEIDLLDGNMHTIIYTFKRGYRQMLIIDGEVIGESEFSPAVKQAATGFLVSNLENEIESDMADVSIGAYDKMVEIGETSYVITK